MGVLVRGGWEVGTAVGQHLMDRGQDLSQDASGQGRAGFLQDRGDSALPTPRCLALGCQDCRPSRGPRRSPWASRDLRLR